MMRQLPRNLTTLTPETLHTHPTPNFLYSHTGILWQDPIKPAHKSFMETLQPADSEREQRPNAVPFTAHCFWQVKQTTDFIFVVKIHFCCILLLYHLCDAENLLLLSCERQEWWKGTEKRMVCSMSGAQISSVITVEPTVEDTAST